MSAFSGGVEVSLSRIVPEFAGLPASVLHDLSQCYQIRQMAAGEVLADAGDPFETVGFVTDGILRMQKTLPDGRQHLLGLVVAGDMFGRVFDGPMQFAIEAATDATLVTFRRGPFEEILSRSPELDRLILIHFLAEIDCTRDWMVVLSNPRVRGRLAGFFLMLCNRFHGRNKLFSVANGRLTIRIPISRADVAQLLGARPESVSRAFHALADDGLIEIIRPDLVSVSSIEDLALEASEPELADAILERIDQHRAAKAAL